MHTEHPLGFGAGHPIFRVADWRASRDYYVNVLGFALEFAYSDMCCLCANQFTVFLIEGDQGFGNSWAWMGVSDVEKLHAHYVTTGARIHQPPTNYPWALEMKIADLDGNIIRMGSEPRDGEPTGPWRDMYGRLWRSDVPGEYVRAESGPVVQRDRLFLLQPGFSDAAIAPQPFFCVECSALEGLLATMPQLALHIDVERIAFAKPRARLVTLLGEAAQNCPVLVLASVPDAALPGVQVSAASGAAFVSGAVSIGEYLAARYEMPRPHP